MRAKLVRYWYEFDVASSRAANVSPWVGVTAWTPQDAEELIRHRLFGGGDLPVITEQVEDVDVSGLDENHVLPNMSPSNLRGIWYPRGFEEK
jgi:hypothetical protein